MLPSPRRVLGLASLLSLSLAALGPAAAQVADVGSTASVDEEAKAKPDSWRFTVGLGVGLVPDYVGSDNYALAPLPKLRAQNGSYYADLTGPFITSNVLPMDTWQFGPAAQFIKGDRCNSADNTVNNMKCQSDSLMLGGVVGYNYRLSATSRLTPRARLLFDAAGASEGYTFEPMLEFTERLTSDWGLLAQGNMIVSSDAFSDYYFGVNGRQARDSGLKNREAEGGVQQLGFTLIGRYSITERWNLDLIGRYQRLVDDAADSPLVDGTSNNRGNANQFIFGVLGSYTF